jgi:hypothetical protein
MLPAHAYNYNGMVGNQWLTHVKEWQEMMDGHMSRNSRRTMNIILGTDGNHIRE